MSAPRCWLCGRKMKLNKGRRGYWLHCGPCAATYMDVKGKSLDEFLASYERNRGGGQLTLALPREENAR